jgi:uncharacterized protein (DUF342 family)|tara:strand:+ start:782 stop:994 length:213 start_codon:yes stop_codon:yes gene_type:complete
MSQDTRRETKFDALHKKYEADIAIAKAELDNYFEVSVGVGEHPHIIEDMDKLLDNLTSAEEKLKALRDHF